MEKETNKIVVSAILWGSVLLILVGMYGLYQSRRFNDNKLHVVFCNVGQGDGIFIKTPQNHYILLDGGPDKSILSCLERHMPFWHRTIHLGILSHPHLDHFFGFLDVIKRYSVTSFVTEELTNKTTTYLELTHELTHKEIPVRKVGRSDTFKTKDGVIVTILGPSSSYLKTTSPGGTIGESAEFASLVVSVSYGTFDVIFTGDSQVQGLLDAGVDNLEHIEVLQIPHHGSKSGITRELLGTISPKLAVISVGKNKYGHPTKEVLDILEQERIKILRTDQRGDIEVVTDGKTWSVR